MRTRSNVLGAILVATLLPCSARADEEKAAAEIKGLVPAAAAMSQQEFEQLATASSVPKVSDLKNKSLTLMLFALKESDDKQAKEEFRFLGDGMPKPSQLAQEMYRTIGVGRLRVPVAPVTMIQANRITEVRCNVDGDTAKGTISYHVPKLYQGRVDYVARRTEGKWRIEEFLMPAYGIHIVRAKDGRWQEAAQEAAKENADEP